MSMTAILVMWPRSLEQTDFPTPLVLYMQFGFNQLSGFREYFKTTESEGPRNKISNWPLVFYLSFGIYESSFSRFH